MKHGAFDGATGAVRALRAARAAMAMRSARAAAWPLVLSAIAWAAGAAPALPADAAADAGGRNIVIFVADGLRAGSVTPSQAPTLYALAHAGSWFDNSHSVAPTLTMPNAAAIATGHYPGDSGIYANTLYPGFAPFDHGAFGRAAGSPLAMTEADPVLGDLDAHFEGNLLGEDTLLALARAHGYGTAAVGKLGPVGVQDVSLLAPVGDRFAPPPTLVIDDRSGYGDSLPIDPELAAALSAAGLADRPPSARVDPAAPAQANGAPRGATHAASAPEANAVQQSWLVQATIRAVLPVLARRGRPFVLVYWSRDPDISQHGQRDSLGSLVPGINGPTSLAAVRNADGNLRDLLAALRADARLAGNTDVLVTSDHGFSTISRREVDAQGHATRSPAAAARYEDVPQGFLPPGFLALDLAAQLGLDLYDPDAPPDAGGGFHLLRAAAAPLPAPGTIVGHPLGGNGLLGGSGARGAGGTDARAIVAANGGIDLVYLPQRDPPLLASIVAALAHRDYVGSLFVDDSYGSLPGTLPMGLLGYEGSSLLPRPALLVGLRSFSVAGGVARGPFAPLLNSAQVSDTGLAHGQGMHGAIARENTWNFMAAQGPDFRAGFRDPLPVGNADLVPTVAAILGWELPSHGQLRGRVLEEAMRVPPAVAGSDAGTGGAEGDARRTHERCVASAMPLADGRGTVLEYQRAAGRLYVDTARFERVDKPGTHCQRVR